LFVSNFLFNLANRALGERPDVRPRLPWLFESVAPTTGPKTGEAAGLEHYDFGSDEESAAPLNRSGPTDQVHTRVELPRESLIDQAPETGTRTSLRNEVWPPPATTPVVRLIERVHVDESRQPSNKLQQPAPALSPRDPQSDDLKQTRGEVSVPEIPPRFVQPRISSSEATEKRNTLLAPLSPMRNLEMPNRSEMQIPQPTEHITRESRHDERQPAEDVREQIRKSAVVQPQLNQYSDPPLPRSQTDPVSVNEQVINVTIGRLEVRASSQANSSSAPSKSRSPVMGLDDYLSQRSGSKKGGGR
jgi:hypothetical protein